MSNHPEGNPQKYTLEDLLYLMARLRDPVKGCPWDIKQSFETIVPSTIEEAYEVADAIEHGDRSHIKEELGDLLFQVVFYSQLGKEEGAFDFTDIIAALTEKLIRRHPHVFPPNDLYGEVDQTTQTEADVKKQWEEIKKSERQNKGKSGLLDDVPSSLPANTRAVKLQKRAASVGFDWENARAVIEKVKEEVNELELALASDNQTDIEEELGDLLFSCVNVSRHLKVDPETALRKANQKFCSRFEFVEKAFDTKGLTLQKSQQPLMESLWQEAKRKPE